MNCSLNGTALWQLLRGALALTPDFSEWRGARREGDEDFLEAPEVIGQYLALKKMLLQKKRTGHIKPENLRECEVAMALLMSAAETEFLGYIRDHPIRDRLRLRSDGWIVLVARATDK